MANRTLLLDVDATLLVDVRDPVLEYASYKGSGDYESTPVPPGARELTVADPDGRSRAVFVPPGAVDALGAQAEAGVDIVWNTRWLATPQLLRDLTDELGLSGIVRFPAASELAAPPTTELPGPGRIGWDEWKMLSLVARVRDLPAGHDLVAADEWIDLSTSRVFDRLTGLSGNRDALLGCIPTLRTQGLDVSALRSWTPVRHRVPVWHRGAADVSPWG